MPFLKGEQISVGGIRPGSYKSQEQLLLQTLLNISNHNMKTHLSSLIIKQEQQQSSFTPSSTCIGSFIPTKQKHV